MKGPWEQAILLTLPNKVQSKSNYRRGRNWTAFSKYERDLAIEVKAKTPENWDIGSYKDKISKRPKIVIQILAESLLDAGNLSKSILDALEGVLYHNDASVAAVTCTGVRSRDGVTILAVARLKPDSNINEVQYAVRELNKFVTERYNIES